MAEYVSEFFFKSVNSLFGKVTSKSVVVPRTARLANTLLKDTLYGNGTATGQTLNNAFVCWLVLGTVVGNARFSRCRQTRATLGGDLKVDAQYDKPASVVCRRSNQVDNMC